MSYFPLTEIIVVVIIFGILLLLSRIKSSEAEPTETTPTAETSNPAPEPSQKTKESAKQTGRSTFFPDKPSSHDYLDFKSYAGPIAELISLPTTQTPLTVGIFGAWGAGKTTLMYLIEKSLEENSNSTDFVVVHFEAWKYYKEDALWRAMLLRVLDTLRDHIKDTAQPELKKTIEQMEQSLYRDVEWEEKGGLTIDWPKLAKAGAGGAMKLSFSLVPGLSTIMEAIKAVENSLGKGDISADVSAVAEAFQRDLVTHHQSQLRHIEEFQKNFSDLVQTHFKGKRLVIFVDDLDRCLPEKAIEVLEAIKLFLDVEGCVFVLGIDQEVITRGLKARYKEAGFLNNGESEAFSVHYIEKLIQLPFHLPPIEAREMKQYIDELEVDWPDPKCPEIFAEGLSPNPRQMKRTINVYLLLWKLAKQRRESLKAVTELRLAKVVILQTAYPYVFDRLKSKAVLLQELEQLSRQPDSSITEDQDFDPFLIEAVKQPNLKRLFELLPDDDLASFAGLTPDELTTFFSLARKAPLVGENLARETPAAAPPVPSVEPVPSQESRPGVVSERPFQLRAPVGDFVGRDEELERMTTALRNETSIGVVTGMGGTGKTEFALLVAEQLREHYPEGQIFIDMHGGEEKPARATVALSACIRAFGGNPRDLSSDADLVAAYRSLLNGKRVLVLLDNVATATQVTPLIPPKGSALLITSRKTLIVPGMTGITLDQLRSEEALALFKSISPRVPENVAAEICRLCGYLPLAIRFAASRLEVTADLDPAAYAAQLRDEQKRFELLRTDVTGTLEKSLEASFNLSYSLLTKPAATVFRKLAVFPETFDAKAEEVICDDPEHAHLSELIKFGLALYESRDSRYRVHSLLRLFAQRHLKETDSEDVKRKHAKYYLQVVTDADALYSKGSIEGLSTFDREQANIDAGLSWSASQPPSDTEAASIHSDYARYSSQFLELRKLPEERIELFTRALDVARQIRNSRNEMAHLIDLGAAHSKLGKTQQAIDCYTDALKIAQELQLPHYELRIHRNLGLKYRDLGRVKEAMSHVEQQLAISQTSGDSRGESEALVSWANLLFIDGRAQEAIEKFDNAVSISRKISDLQGEAMALGNLARVYNYIGDTGRALDLFRQQIEISQTKLGDRLGEALGRFNIALTLKQTGQLNEAREEASAALKIFEELKEPKAMQVKEWLAKLPPNE